MFFLFPKVVCYYSTTFDYQVGDFEDSGVPNSSLFSRKIHHSLAPQKENE